MPGLLDIAQAATKTVSVNGTDVSVYGVSAKGIAVLFEKFPSFRELMGGKTPEMTPDVITKFAPDAIAAIIAAGTGDPGNAKAEKIAANLPAGDQASLLEAILDLTMPRGFGPFVDSLVRIFGVVNVGPTSTADMKSPNPSSDLPATG